MPGVGESAVIGVPHAEFGEAVVVIARPDTPPDAAALIGELKSKIANCVNDSEPCACGAVKLDEASLQALRGRFSSCLCLNCLRRVQVNGGAG